MSDTIEFELADNAFDYVLSATEYAKGETPRDLKYAILHLFAGIELLLKARLYEEHWTLIFSDSDKANQKNLASGDFRSVDFETSCKRLNNVLGIELESKTIGRLDELRKVRNKVQHFQVNIETSEVQSLLAFGLNFVLDFTSEHLPALLTTRKEALESIHQHLGEFKEFVAHRLNALKPQLDEAGMVIECPQCFQETLVIGGHENPKCLFCNAEVPAEELAESTSETAQAERCPECEREAAAVHLVGGNDGDLIWLCFACGQKGDYRRCFRCDNLMSEKEGPCQECTEEWMSKND